MTTITAACFSLSTLGAQAGTATLEVDRNAVLPTLVLTTRYGAGTAIVTETKTAIVVDQTTLLALFVGEGKVASHLARLDKATKPMNRMVGPSAVKVAKRATVKAALAAPPSPAPKAKANRRGDEEGKRSTRLADAKWATKDGIKRGKITTSEQAIARLKKGGWSESEAEKIALALLLAAGPSAVVTSKGVEVTKDVGAAVAQAQAAVGIPAAKGDAAAWKALRASVVRAVKGGGMASPTDAIHALVTGGWTLAKAEVEGRAIWAENAPASPPKGSVMAENAPATSSMAPEASKRGSKKASLTAPAPAGATEQAKPVEKVPAAAPAPLAKPQEVPVATVLATDDDLVAFIRANPTTTLANLMRSTKCSRNRATRAFEAFRATLPPAAAAAKKALDAAEAPAAVATTEPKPDPVTVLDSPEEKRQLSLTDRAQASVAAKEKLAATRTRRAAAAAK